MIKNRPNGHATHFRLSPESWVEILEAYRNGATARELAARWKVAPGTIYRYVRERGFTKKANSDAVARAHAQAMADEEAEALARRDDPTLPEPDTDPAALRKQAMTDMARALAAGRTAEADRLGRLILTLDKVSGAAAREEDPAYSEFERHGVAFIDPAEPEDSPRRRAWREFARDIVHKQDVDAEESASRLFPLIQRVAVGMLGDRAHAPAIFSRAVFRWRAETFGPELARHDFEQMRAGGWDDGIFNEDGSIIEGWDFVSRLHPAFNYGLPPRPPTPTAGASPDTPPASP